jgi:hypothetical protein
MADDNGLADPPLPHQLRDGISLAIRKDILFASDIGTAMSRSVDEQQSRPALQRLPERKEGIFEARARTMEKNDRGKIRFFVRLDQNAVEFVTADIDPDRLWHMVIGRHLPRADHAERRKRKPQKQDNLLH